MRKFFLGLASILMSFQGFSQAALPTSYNFDNFSSAASLPTGWSTNISGTFTYSSGQSGLAGKIDIQGEYIQIQTADPIGSLSYYLRGWIGGGASSWSGTFKVQESINGTTWTDLASYTSLNSNAYELFTVSPASNSRYVRFFYETKIQNAGSNVGLDEVSATLGVLPNREINVKQNSTTIFNGGSASALGTPIGTPVNLTFSVENQGSAEALDISSITFSGVDAADYSVASPSTPFSINGGTAQNVVVTFDPTANGTRYATMEINSNDADESVYSIVLNCTGGQYATEPTEPAASMNFSNIKSYRYSATLTGTSGAEGYLVLRKIGSAVTGLPADGEVYSIGDPIGDAKVVYSGVAGTFSANDVVENTEYHFAVFSYNGTSVVRNYLQSTPLTATVTSAANNFGSLYSTINTSNPTFVNDLQTLINPHTSIFYGNYDETMVRLFEARDTTDGQRVLTCVYSGEQYIYNEPYGWAYMSREHTYCHAWMPTNPADDPEKPEYNDQHHLFPAQFENANQVRLDYPLGEVVTPASTYLGCKIGQNANGKIVFEPRDAHKGDAARALFYMCTTYNGVSGNNWGLPNTSTRYQDQNILRKWHYQDPPSNYEMARNEFLDSLQGNRNPFIDHPEYACYINFQTMEYIAGATEPCNNTSIGMNEPVLNEMMVLPNPSVGVFTIVLETTSADINLVVTDITGKVVHKQFIAGGINQTIGSLDLQHLSNGVYILQANANGSSSNARLVIQK
ncbi:MAG TPA: endonuclease [Flavobacteriales bacterium]|nr:endonuclease [Flavobacteriales bacterium]